jgi:diguanylate cyclase (GGDEF)-like protein/PAS domain S-box-containing protein
MREAVAAAMKSGMGDELHDDRYLLDTFLENTTDHVYFKDAEGRFLRVSRALAAWLGVGDPADAIGRTDFDFFAEEHARATFEDERRLLRTGEPLVGIEERERWPDGRETWVSTTKVPLRDADGRIVGLFGISRDITEKRRDQERLAEQARTLAAQAQTLASLALVDDLTGLNNRRGFTIRGEQLLERSRRDGVPAALLFLDLDGLKRVNDTFGHDVGDGAILALADAIRRETREADVAARLGGDEFCVLVGGGEAAATETARRIRVSLRRARLPFDPEVSVGALAVDPRARVPIDSLLSEADRVMYADKQRRRGGSRRVA